MKNWKNITYQNEVDLIINLSEEKPQIIFKDSVSCGISAFAKQRLSKGNELLVDNADFNYLDLLAHRDISNYIAEKLKVIHQSPQIIVLKNKEVVYSVTHHSIEPKTISKYL